jgi:hypothetical protein
MTDVSESHGSIGLCVPTAMDIVVVMLVVVGKHLNDQRVVLGPQDLKLLMG